MPYSRLAGWLLLISAILSIITVVLPLFIPGPLGPFGPAPVWLGWATAVVAVVTLIGLPALYTSQKQAGWVGLVGMIVFFLFLLLSGVVQNAFAALAFTGAPANIPASTEPITPPPAVIIGFIVGTLLQLIGSILLAIAILRARVFPRWTGWALIVSAILAIFASTMPGGLVSFLTALLSTVSEIVAVAALGWIGMVLATRSSAPTELARRVA